MKNNLESSEVSSAEWLSLNQFLYEIKQIDSIIGSDIPTDSDSATDFFNSGSNSVSILSKPVKNKTLAIVTPITILAIMVLLIALSMYFLSYY